LALTSDLFDVLLPLLCGTKSDFLDFLGEPTRSLRNKTAKLANSSETVQRNSLRGWNPQVVSIPNFLKFKRTAQVRGLLQIQMESAMPDL
jgi:hypothetical protein